MVQSLWDPAAAAQAAGTLEELVYRSNIIGADRRVCNIYGGNTSAKTVVKDFRGRDVEVMYVKGSGSDLASMKAEHFTALRLDDIRPLLEREAMTDEEMVEYLSHTMMDARHPRASMKRCFMPSFLFRTWTTPIPMPLSASAAPTTARRSRGKFSAAASCGCPMSGRDLRCPK